MVLKNSYCHQIHIIWLKWHPRIIIIHRDPIDPWWVAWTLGYKNIVFGDNSKQALRNIVKKIRSIKES